MAFQKSLTYLLCIVALCQFTQGKPSIPQLEYPFLAHQVDFAPPLLPPTHFHAPVPAPAPLVPAPAPLLPAPAPAQFFHAPLPVLPPPPPAPVVSAHAHVIPAQPAFFHAPAPIPVAPAPLPAPVVHAPVLPVAAPVAKVLPPVIEPVPFVAPSYRVIPGPKTTTHHVSVGFAQPAFAPAPLVAHTTFAKLKHHHHHSLF